MGKGEGADDLHLVVSDIESGGVIYDYRQFLKAMNEAEPSEYEWLTSHADVVASFHAAFQLQRIADALDGDYEDWRSGEAEA